MSLAGGPPLRRPSETLKAEPISGAPDVLGTIEGWRSWRFYRVEGLRSIFSDEWWPPQEELVARCSAYTRTLGIRKYGPYRSQPRHNPPSRGCICGIYAAAEGKYWGIPQGDVYGKVKMWGTVIRGTKANRASHACISELYAPDHLLNNPMLKAYGVPIRPFREMPWQLRLRRRGLRPSMLVPGLWGLLAALSVAGAVTGTIIPYLSSVAIIGGFAAVLLLKG